MIIVAFNAAKLGRIDDAVKMADTPADVKRMYKLAPDSQLAKSVDMLGDAAKTSMLSSVDDVADFGKFADNVPTPIHTNNLSSAKGAFKSFQVNNTGKYSGLQAEKISGAFDSIGVTVKNGDIGILKIVGNEVVDVLPYSDDLYKKVSSLKDGSVAKVVKAENVGYDSGKMIYTEVNDSFNGQALIKVDNLKPTAAQAGKEGVGGEYNIDDIDKDTGKLRLYSNIPDSLSVGPGKKFSMAQKNKIIQVNMTRNGGIVKSDLSGKALSKPAKSQKGIKPDPNEWQVDHIKSRMRGGSNSNKNAQVLSREENREKWDK